MTRAKVRKLELAAGAPSRKGVRGIAGNKNPERVEAERELARQAEAAYRRTIADWTAAGPLKVGAGATSGRASSRPPRGKAARQTTAPTVCASPRQSPAPNSSFAEEARPVETT